MVLEIKILFMYVPLAAAGFSLIMVCRTLGLIAYRYMGMFYRYGGVPIVRKSFSSTDDLTIHA